MTNFTKLLKEHSSKLHKLEEKLGYRFQQPEYLAEALIHRSFAFEQGKDAFKDNEILEFLGDAVLDLALSDSLNRQFPDMREGELTKLRAALVNESHLAVMARAVLLGEFLFLGKGEARSNGRDKSSILSCAFEAVVGAIFKDGGYEAAAQFIKKHFEPWYTKQKKAVRIDDAKSRLQELIQEKYNETPEYVVEHEKGPDHKKEFTVSVRFRDHFLAKGTASSKKTAAQKAAAIAVENFDSFDFEK